jgi:hypothetical protein
VVFVMRALACANAQASLEIWIVRGKFAHLTLYATLLC